MVLVADTMLCQEMAPPPVSSIEKVLVPHKLVPVESPGSANVPVAVP